MFMMPQSMQNQLHCYVSNSAEIFCTQLHSANITQIFSKQTRFSSTEHLYKWYVRRLEKVLHVAT